MTIPGTERITCLFEWCREPVDALPTKPKATIERHLLPAHHGGGVCPASLLSWPHSDVELAMLSEQATVMSDRITDDQIKATERRRMREENPITGQASSSFGFMFPGDGPDLFRPGPGGSDRHHPGLNVKDERIPQHPATPDPEGVAQDYASRGDGTVKHLQCGTLHGPGKPCPLEGNSGPVGTRTGPADDPAWQPGGRQDAEIIELKPGEKAPEVPPDVFGIDPTKASPIPPKSKGTNRAMSMNEVFGSINSAKVTSTEAISGIQTAKEKLEESSNILVEVQGNVSSDTLEEYIGVLRQCAQDLDQIINKIQHGHELGEGYIGRLSS